MGGQSGQFFDHLVKLKMGVDMGELCSIILCNKTFQLFYIVRKRYRTDKNTFLILMYLYINKYITSR